MARTSHMPIPYIRALRDGILVANHGDTFADGAPVYPAILMVEGVLRHAFEDLKLAPADVTRILAGDRAHATHPDETMLNRALRTIGRFLVTHAEGVADFNAPRLAPRPLAVPVKTGPPGPKAPGQDEAIGDVW